MLGYSQSTTGIRSNQYNNQQCKDPTKKQNAKFSSVFIENSADNGQTFPLPYIAQGQALSILPPMM